MPFLSASGVVIYYEEALYQVYAPLLCTKTQALVLSIRLRILFSCMLKCLFLDSGSVCAEMMRLHCRNVRLVVYEAVRYNEEKEQQEQLSAKQKKLEKIDRAKKKAEEKSELTVFLIFFSCYCIMFNIIACIILSELILVN